MLWHESKAYKVKVKIGDTAEQRAESVGAEPSQGDTHEGGGHDSGEQGR